MAFSHTSVLKTYQKVIDETISSSREAFLDEGIDEQVLSELKHLWETKLTSSKACQVDPPSLETEPLATNSRKTVPQKKTVNDNAVASGGNTFPQQSTQQQQQAPISQTTAVQNNQSALNTGTSRLIQNVWTGQLVPIQIKLPTPEGSDRILTIHVPATALIGNQLQQVLTGPIISATMKLPQQQASALLQQHVNEKLNGAMMRTIPQTDGQFDDLKNKQQVMLSAKCLQVDGADDESSDDDDDVSDEPSDDDEPEDDKDEEDPDLEEPGIEEEPLNSDDDVSEEDHSDMFECDNVIVCQYDKITRTRNKWKFALKDGIMNLNGKDFVLQKLTGDAEW